MAPLPALSRGCSGVVFVGGSINSCSAPRKHAMSTPVPGTTFAGGEASEGGAVERDIADLKSNVRTPNPTSAECQPGPVGEVNFPSRFRRSAEQPGT